MNDSILLFLGQAGPHCGLEFALQLSCTLIKASKKFGFAVERGYTTVFSSYFVKKSSFVISRFLLRIKAPSKIGSTLKGNITFTEANSFF